MNIKLLPCPFCGGTAELDATQGYSAFPSGEHGTAVAVYCLSCQAEISLCREDLPECDTDELIEMVTTNWNKRTPK